MDVILQKHDRAPLLILSFNYDTPLHAWKVRKSSRQMQWFQKPMLNVQPWL